MIAIRYENSDTFGWSIDFFIDHMIQDDATSCVGDWMTTIYIDLLYLPYLVDGGR